MSKKKSNHYSKAELERAVLEYFKQHPSKSYNYKQLSNALGIKTMGGKEQLIAMLRRLEEENVLEQVYQGKYKLHPLEVARIMQQPSYTTGIIEITATGRAYVKSPDFEDDIKIEPGRLNRAMNGDEVKVFLYARRSAKRPEGEVVEVLNRAKTQFVGTIQATDRFAFLIPDNNELGMDIFIPLNQLNGAKNGDKAIVKLSHWPDNSRSPIGEVIKVLGKPGDHETEICSILVNYNLPLEFPEDVEKEAAAIPHSIPDSEIKNRWDYRDVITFTIDPEDAKDFDDALSLKKLSNGNYEVGVHIADVSWYVKPGTLLDKEAAKRATSIYLVDRVIPMLPEKLSNDVCSLNPNEDKLCFAAIFELDERANVINEKFGRTVIRSCRRFTYEEAQERIEKGEGDYADELRILDKLAKELRRQRFRNGAISFDKTEVRFRLDEKGVPISVFFKEMKDSNKMIEEFMLLANKRVAELIGKQTPVIPMVYRVHDSPDFDKLQEFSRFVGKLGYRMKLGNPKQIVASYNKLLEDVKGKPEQNLIETLAVRTMAKAHYTTKNIGHYGLAFTHYTHFTSPIRRYPDILAHRILEKFLEKKKITIPNLEELCKHSSKMELSAADAERESVKFKQVEYLTKFIGQEFDGYISGVTKWGIFVELIENKCEGMVRLNDIEDDYYYFDEDNYRIVGSRYKHVYQLGDKVRVIVLRTNKEKKQIDFRLVQ